MAPDTPCEPRDDLLQRLAAAVDRPFASPAEARAFALVVQLAERGAFGWPEWTQALGAQVRQRPQATPGAQWLAAAEALVQAKGLASAEELEARRFGLAISQRARDAAHRRA